MARHYVIFVPGLADKTYSFWLQLAMFLWVKNWLKPFYFVSSWANKNETFTQKLERLVTVIDHAAAKGYVVSLVAASAGSSLALNALHRRPDRIHRFISIVGKLKHPEATARELFELNPAFEQSLKTSTRIEPELTATERKKILIVRATHDSYVPDRDGAVTGAQTFTMRAMGHVSSIIMALTIYQYTLIRFIKKA